MLGEMAAASQERARHKVRMRKMHPATNTEPSRCCQVMPINPKAMKAFSPMYGATASGRLA